MSGRGVKPSPKLALHSAFVTAVRDHLGGASMRPLALLCGWPHSTQLCFTLRHHIAVSDLNVDRLHKLAVAVGYAGDLFEVAS